MTDVIRKTYFYQDAQVREYHVDKPLSQKAWYRVANQLFDLAHDATDRIAAGHPLYEPATRMDELVRDSDPIIHHTFDAGEGVLIPGEIIHHAKRGCRAFVILQPFGCLPNHVVGRGVAKRLKAMFPDAQILPLDYDPDVSFANVENRLQMLIMSVRGQAAAVGTNEPSVAAAVTRVDKAAPAAMTEPVAGAGAGAAASDGLAADVRACAAGLASIVREASSFATFIRENLSEDLSAKRRATWCMDNADRNLSMINAVIDRAGEIAQQAGQLAEQARKSAGDHADGTADCFAELAVRIRDIAGGVRARASESLANGSRRFEKVASMVQEDDVDDEAVQKMVAEAKAEVSDLSNEAERLIVEVRAVLSNVERATVDSERNGMLDRRGC